MRSIKAYEPLSAQVLPRIAAVATGIGVYCALVSLLVVETPPVPVFGLRLVFFALFVDVCSAAIAYGVGGLVGWSVERLMRPVDARSTLERAINAVRSSGPLALSDVGRPQWLLPDDLRVSVREIESIVHETIAIPELDALGDDAYVLRATVDRYLPEALARYYVSTQFAPSAAAEAELREQVALLRNSVARIAVDARASGDALSRFLRERLR